MLALSGIEKSFGAVAVLRGVDLELRAGEVHAVLGENGAGKSTLMRIVLGIERAERGTMTLAGEPYAPRGPADARRAGIVMVPQERTLCPHLDVVENIVLGIEPAGPLGALRFARAEAAARRALALVAGEERIPLFSKAGALGVADQQLVEIARALLQGGDAARVLVLDEPTASLGKADAERLFSRVATLKASGLAIVLVTHFLGDVRSHADRYTVLRDGKVRGAGDPTATGPEQIVHEMMGRELESVRDEIRIGEPEPEGDVVLEVRDVAGRVKPRSASFVLRRGEILGIAGLVGSGRTELLRAVAGLDRVKRGEVVVRAPRGIGLLSEDRGGEGLMLDRSIADNIQLSPRGPRIVDPRAVRAEGARWIEELKIRASGPDQRAGDLSGGNQQKVQLARLLREDFDVLLVDEPTRGIDVAAKAQVLELLRDLAKRGKGILLVSSQLEELVVSCDRIAVLRRGELGPARPANERDEEQLLLEAAFVSALASLRAMKRPAWLGPLVALLGVYLIFAAITPEHSFLRAQILLTMGRQSVVLALCALGMTLVIVTGGIDLSTGSLVALTTVILAKVLKTGGSPVLAVAVAVFAAGAVGAFIGVCVGRFRLMPFVVTLGAMAALRGAAIGLASEQKIDCDPKGLDRVLTASLSSPGIWISLGLAGLVALVLGYTRFGRHVFAVGSNEAAARLCGIDAGRVKILAYTLSSMLVGVAGVMEFSTLTVGDPTDSVGLELDVIAAVVIGGAPLAGGEGSVVGSVFGALLMTVIRTGAVHMGMPSWVQLIVTGAIIFVAVALDSARRRRARV